MPNQPDKPEVLESMARRVLPTLSYRLYRRPSFDPEHSMLGGLARDQGPTDPEGKIAWDEDSFVKRVFFHFKQYGLDYSTAMGNYARWLVRDPPENENNYLSIDHLASAVVWMYFWPEDERAEDVSLTDKMIDKAQRRLERETDSRKKWQKNTK
ncbi:Nn.00g011450.m01.CDS01 [Neocucurbitaria sp. VM-36]